MDYQSIDKTLDIMTKNTSDLCTNTFDMIFNEFPNLVGMGLGSLNILGQSSGTPSLTLLVDNSSNAPSKKIEPLMYSAVTDVLEVGSIELLSSHLSDQDLIEVPSSTHNSYGSNNYNYFNSNLLEGGESCLNYNSSALGTIGCLVKDYDNVYMLSNNHILNNNNTYSSNSMIYSSKNHNYPIATLSKYAEINHVSPNVQVPRANKMDAALAYIGKVHDLPFNASSRVRGINKINGTTDIKIDNAVQKVGANSGATNGKVLLLNAAIRLKYNGKDTIFTNQIVTTSMANSGDSGSIGLNSHNSAFGLLFAGNSKISIYNPIKPILNKFGVNLF